MARPAAHPFYAFFDLRSGVEVFWMTHPRTTMIHATFDGRSSLCGCQTPLTNEIPSSMLDPSNDLMTCMRCQEQVRRVRRPSSS